MTRSKLIPDDDGALWLEADVDREWRVRYRLDVVRGRIAFAEAHVVPRGKRTPGRGINANVLRAVAVGEHRRELLAEMGETRAARLLAEHPELRAYVASLTPEDLEGMVLSTELFDLDALRPRREKGRRKSRRWYAEVARLYAALVAAGATRPIPTMVEMMGLAPATVSGAVRDARQMGFLTKTRSGRAGGRLTAKAERLLHNDDEKGV